MNLAELIEQVRIGVLLTKEERSWLTCKLGIASDLLELESDEWLVDQAVFKHGLDLTNRFTE